MRADATRVCADNAGRRTRSTRRGGVKKGIIRQKNHWTVLMIAVNKIAVMYRAAVRAGGPRVVGGSPVLDRSSRVCVTRPEKLPSNSVGIVIVRSFFFFVLFLLYFDWLKTRQIPGSFPLTRYARAAGP